MFNPLDSIRRYQSRIGKPIRPIVEIQKGGSVVNVITTTVQEGNVINNTYQQEAWELHPGDPSTAVYIDGVFKGVGYYAGEEGQILSIKKDVVLKEEVKDKSGNVVYDASGLPTMRQVITMTYTGLFGKLLDAQLIERGSALKASLADKLVFLFIGILLGIVGMMTYGN